MNSRFFGLTLFLLAFAMEDCTAADMDLTKLFVGAVLSRSGDNALRGAGFTPEKDAKEAKPPERLFR